MATRLHVPMSVEQTRDLFVREMVYRRGGSVGLELGLAGYADARRRFVLAIQGWERNVWIRPLLTRIEGYFEKTPYDDLTYVVFVRRGLAFPLFVLGLMIPYTVARFTIQELPLTVEQVLPVLFALALVVLGCFGLLMVERRVYKLLIKGLLDVYGNPPSDKI